MRAARTAAGEAGFTLIEALVALAIGGFVIAVLATITGQWLRSWRHGYPQLQQAELLAANLDAIVADLSAARFMPAAQAGPGVMFSGTGTAVTLVRRSLAVEGSAGLEVVRLSPPPGKGDVTLARSRSPLPFGTFAPASTDPAPVVLLRAPYAVRFSYADADQRWQGGWAVTGRLPRLIRVEMIDRPTGRAVVAPVVVAVHVEAPMRCASVATAKACDEAMGVATAGLPTAPPPRADGGQL